MKSQIVGWWNRLVGRRIGFSDNGIARRRAEIDFRRPDRGAGEQKRLLRGDGEHAGRGRVEGAKNNSSLTYTLRWFMTSEQSNKYGMYMATANLLKSSIAKTQAIPAFAASYTKLDTLVAQIAEKDKERMGKTPGKHAVRDEAEDALVTAVMIVSSGLMAMARAKGNTQLREAAYVRESRMRHARSTEQINTAKLVYDLGVANKVDLVPFAVTESMLEDLKARIAAYEAAIKELASGIAERVGARTAVSDLFVQADEVIKEEIDRMMQVFRVTDPELYNDYRAARVIKDLGARHLKPGQPAAAPAGSPN